MNLINLITTTAQSVAANTPIPLTTISRRTGCACQFGVNGVFINKPGYYLVTGTVTFEGTAQVITLGVLKFVLFIIVYFAILIGMIFVQESERRIPIQYANKSTNAYGASQSFMPIKINTAGVIPVIFASSLLYFNK